MRINMHKVQNNFSLKKKIKLFSPLSYPHCSTSFQVLLVRAQKRAYYLCLEKAFTQHEEIQDICFSYYLVCG